MNCLPNFAAGHYGHFYCRKTQFNGRVLTVSGEIILWIYLDQEDAGFTAASSSSACFSITMAFQLDFKVVSIFKLLSNVGLVPRVLRKQTVGYSLSTLKELYSYNTNELAYLKIHK